MLSTYKQELKERESATAELLQAFYTFIKSFQTFAQDSLDFQKTTNQNFKDLKLLLTIDGEGSGNLIESLLKAIQNLQKAVENSDRTNQELLAEIQALQAELKP